MKAFCVEEEHDAVSIARDTRSRILYMDGNEEIHPEHSYVMVKCSSEIEQNVRIAYAKLKPITMESQYPSTIVTASDTLLLSSGLRAALRLTSAELAKVGTSAYRGVVPKIDIVSHQAKVNEDATTPSKNAKNCLCEVGIVDSVSLSFLDFQIPNIAAQESLQRVSVQLLHSTVLWDGKYEKVNWFGRECTVKFSGIKWNKRGDGCCEKIGMIDGHVSSIDICEDVIRPLARGDFLPSHIKSAMQFIAGRLGGVQSQSLQVLELIYQRFTKPKLNILGEYIGCVVTGIAGIGKTSLVQCITQSIGFPVIWLCENDTSAALRGDLHTHLMDKFQAVFTQREECILVIDGLENFALKRQFNSTNTLQLKTLLLVLDYIKESSEIFVIATTCRLDDIDQSICSNGRLEFEVQLEPPTRKQRLEILEIIAKDWPSTNDVARFLAQASDSTGGYVAADLIRLCQRILLDIGSSSQSKSPGDASSFDISEEIVRRALSSTFPSVLQGYTILRKGSQFCTNADPFAKFHGLDDIIREIRIALLEPLMNCDRYLRFGAVPPKGILLSGPSGSGKTEVALAVATECERSGLATFISVKCTELINKVVGDTEKALAALFKSARLAAPCIIYFDQIECLAPVRGFDSSTEQTFDRLLSYLLIEMDGFNTRNEAVTSNEFVKQHIVILATTTDIRQLDPAILRPGRFDTHLQLHLPNEKAREDIILDLSTQIPLEYDSTLDDRQRVAKHIARRTESWTALNIQQIFQEAAMATLRSNVDAKTVPIDQVIRSLDALALSR
uniref:Cell division cycle protein 48 putative n=1 Tax=Albugo laibachii Nc14 TaxID=890382 RepID=F0WJH1_9STRA|nr:cell division cycle protein 48 putative [Albugo laibachii Nc14]|eukprot:CCA21420.1 cell division cycle protein 48 putative [Albugo laibachii Nc14]